MSHKNKLKSYLSLRQVVELDYCVGCGLCVSQSSQGRMLETDLGTYIPDLNSLTDDEISRAEEFCPSARNSDGELRIANNVFDVKNLNYLDGLGYYHKTYAGYAIEGDFRNKGSSAGLVNWLCAKLLEIGEVDSIIHVKEETSLPNIMYSYKESFNIDELHAGAKSKYYPIELSGMIKKLLETPDKKVAIVGVPCFIKALRGLEEQNLSLKKKIKYHIGIVCGHLKSKHYAEFLGWQAGIEPNNLKLLDFRTKIPSRPASKYGFTAVPKNGSDDTWVVKPMADVIGGNWGHGVFKLNACEYCDDVMAETADIVFGDAWLPEFVSDSAGTNIVNSRSLFLTSLLESEAAAGTIKLIDLSAERVLDSQRSGLRHRREGLSYRTLQNLERGKPSPIKRTEPGSISLNCNRSLTYEYRELIRAASHQSFLLAKQYNNLNIAVSTLKPLISSYTKHVNSELSFTKRLLKKFKSVLLHLGSFKR